MAAKESPANQGNVIEPADWGLALWTLRRWRDYREIKGYPADTNVKKAAKCQTGDKQHAFQQSIQSDGMNPRLRFVKAQKISA